jgi:hypothetical protein
MDQPGTIAAVMARLDFLEKRVVALEANTFPPGSQLAAQKAMRAELTKMQASEG